MSADTEVHERLARVEQHLVDLNGWTEKHYNALILLDKRTLEIKDCLSIELSELKQDFTLWRGRESRITKIISGFIALIAAIVVALISRFTGSK